MSAIANPQSPFGNVAGTDRGDPWPGLESFTESQRQLFFGRERETDELARLVRRETLTVLFGQSGLGKSSLLQAGLFPLLREHDHLPLYLRLDHSGSVLPIGDCQLPIGSEAGDAGSIANRESRQLPSADCQLPIASAGRASESIANRQSAIGNSSSLAAQVKTALTAAFAEAKADAPALGPDESLWEYFHRKDVDIWSAKNRLLTPVLVFDQFEEIFTLGRADDVRRARSRAFLTELAELVENRPPATLREKFDRGEADPTRYSFDKPSCRVILSLREDFLPDLEGLRQELPALVHNRLRLKRLNGAQALEAVTRPAPHLLADGVGERIVEFVAGARGGSAERLLELEVEPALLSVICRELNERRRALGQAQITADLVSGNRREILTNFYERSVADLPEPMRAFVEDHLLTKSGFRDNLALETALEFPGVTRPLIDTLVSRRLLRIEDRLGIQRVELTHDVLAEVIRASRDARQQRVAIENERRRERVTRRRMWLARTIAAGLLVACAGVSWVAWRAIRAEREQARLRAEADAVRNREAALRLDAEAQELAAKRKAYASDMNGVQHALATENLGRARELLDRHRPAPGETDLRGWEWRYLWQFCQSDAVGELKPPDNIEVMSVAISADGQWAALGSRREGKVTLCHLTTREQIHLPTGHGNIRLAFSPGKPVLAIFAVETQVGGPPIPKIVLWDLNTRSVQRELAVDGFCSGLAFSPEGETLVASIGRASDPERGANVIRWRVADGSRIAARPAGQWASSTGSSWFAASPDLTLAAVGTGGGTEVSVIDLQTGQPRWSAVATGDLLKCMAFSPDGRVLATGAGFVDSVIRLWDANTGRELGKLEGQRGWTSGLAFLADGKRLVSASADQTLRLWDLETRTAVRAFRGHKTEVHSLAITPDQKMLISGCKDGSAYVWRLDAAATSSASGTIKAGRSTPAFSPSGDAVISVAVDGKVSRWDGPSFQTETPLQPIGPLHVALERWTVDSVIARTRPWIAVTTADNKVQVWDWERGALVREWPAAEETIGFPRAFLSNDTRLLVSIATRQSPLSAFREWDIETGRETLSVEAPASFGSKWGRARSGLRPDGREYLQIEFSNGTGHRWNLTTGQGAPVALNIFQANPAVFSPDGKLVVVSSQAGFVKLYDAETLAEKVTLRGFMFGAHGLEFSADMQRLVTASTGSESITLWDTNSYHRLITLPSPLPALYPVIFSPDGNTLIGQNSAGGATVGHLHFWRAPSWEQIKAAEQAESKRSALSVQQ